MSEVPLYAWAPSEPQGQNGLHEVRVETLEDRLRTQPLVVPWFGGWSSGFRVEVQGLAFRV